MASGCATVSVQPAISTEKEVYLKDVCDQNGIYWQWDPVSQVATLEYKGAKARVLVGSELVLIDKDRVTLSAPVRTVRSTVVVPLDFQSKVISRLRQESVRQQGYGLTKVRKIVIDAGHGGKDPGAIGHMGVQEKDIVLDVSKRVRSILQERGYEVEMTRDKDEFISLEERTEFASRSMADLFVSIHANSSPVRNVNGFEVFTVDYLDFKERNEDQRKKNQNLMFRNLSMSNGDPDVMHIIADMLYVHKLAESDVLAQYFTKETTRSAKTKNRGEKKSRFFVLRNTLVPAVLVEIGFLTNPKEAKLLQTLSYREKMARALAKSIIDYADRN
jgi:N-acetylmuramoyl-L-alanine amidase